MIFQFHKSIKENCTLVASQPQHIYGHDIKHINIQIKYVCSCSHLPTNLNVQSLQSYIYGFYHHYRNVYIYIFYVIWSLPCYIKGFNLSMSIPKTMAFSDWFFFFTKMKKGLYQEMSASKISTQEVFPK